MSRLLRRAAELVAVTSITAASLLLPAGAAQAAWSTSVSGNTRAAAVTLLPPTLPSATITTCTVATFKLKPSWTRSASPSVQTAGQDVYSSLNGGAFIKRNTTLLANGVGTFTDPTNYYTLGGASVIYQIHVVNGNWFKTSVSSAAVTSSLPC